MFAIDTRPTLALLVTLLAAASIGCGEEEVGPSSVDLPDAPIIEGAVALQDFCAIQAELACAAQMNCCGDPLAEIEACAAAVPCLLDDDMPLIEAGRLAYDPVAAGDFLRGERDKAARCELTSTAEVPAIVFGTLAEGDACDVDRDTCAPGLGCKGEEDEVSVSDARCVGLAGGTSGCGDECDDADDYEHTPFCVETAEPEPPANTDWTDPDLVCVQVKDKSGAGTDEDFFLSYLHDGYWNKCKITTGVDRGETKCCAPVRNATLANATNSKGDFYINMTGNDGLRFTKVYVEKNGSKRSKGTYKDGSSIACTGCFLGSDCETCWVDADRSQDCTNVKINMNSGQTYCSGSFNWLNLGY